MNFLTMRMQRSGMRVAGVMYKKRRRGITVDSPPPVKVHPFLDHSFGFVICCSQLRFLFDRYFHVFPGFQFNQYTRHPLADRF